MAQSEKERNARLARELKQARVDAESDNPRVARRAKHRIDDLTNELYTANLRLVYRYTASFGDIVEYQDAGKLALLEAIQTWDEDRGSLATHAFNRIKKAVLKEVARQEHRLKTHAFVARAQIMAAELELTEKLGRSPTHAEVAARSGEAESLVRHIRLNEVAGKTLSLNMSVTEDGQELGDVIQVAAPSAEEVALAVHDEPVSLSDHSPREFAKLVEDCTIMEIAVGLRHTGADDGPATDFQGLVPFFQLSRESLRKLYKRFEAKVSASVSTTDNR